MGYYMSHCNANFRLTLIELLDILHTIVHVVVVDDLRGRIARFCTKWINTKIRQSKDSKWIDIYLHPQVAIRTLFLIGFYLKGFLIVTNSAYTVIKMA